LNSFPNSNSTRPLSFSFIGDSLFLKSTGGALGRTILGYDGFLESISGFDIFPFLF
jgi:hypothetical protein